MVVCDNCGEGQECDSWTDALEFMIDEGWKKKLDNGEWKHYCPECAVNIKSTLNKILEKQKAEISDYNIGFCPVCGDSLWQNRDESNYCFRCGQAIDWSDEP